MAESFRIDRPIGVVRRGAVYPTAEFQRALFTSGQVQAQIVSDVAVSATFARYQGTQAPVSFATYSAPDIAAPVATYDAPMSAPTFAEYD